MTDQPRGTRGVRVFWTREAVIAALQEFERREGRQPVANDCDNIEKRRLGLPSSHAVRARFGSFSAAIEAAGFVPQPQGGQQEKVEETLELRRRLDAGEPLAALAREVGIKPQSLGRRIQRSRERYPD